MISREGIKRLAEMYDYVRTKTAPLPPGAIQAIRAAHPSCRTLEDEIEACLLEANMLKATEKCRAYCTAWRQWAAAYPKAS